jgi:hypothetical protein
MLPSLLLLLAAVLVLEVAGVEAGAVSEVKASSDSII